jgi:hypothetical protein
MAYTYDYNGNMHTMGGANTTTYAWEYENRMTSLELPPSSWWGPEVSYEASGGNLS